MTRVLALGAYLLRDLFRSLAGVVPPVLTLGVYQATFYYSGKVDYFASVGGADLMFVCLITTLIVASRANRAATYPILARLAGRTELLAGIGLAALVTTVSMSILFALLVVVLNGLSLSPGQVLLIAPRWLALFVLTVALGLNMSKLASKSGSYLIVTAVLALMVTVSEQQVFLGQGQGGWIVSAVAFVAAPVMTLITSSVGATDTLTYLMPVLLTSIYAFGLSCLAAYTFGYKDLLWSE